VKAYATYRIPGDGLARLGAIAEVAVWERPDPVPRDALLAGVAGAAALVSTLNDRIDAEVLDAGSQLRVVSVMAVGHDSIDVAACTERGVVVTNTPGVLTDATADLAFALILAVARRLPEAADAARTGGWGRWQPTWMCGMDLAGATIGIVGYGAIGRAVGRRAAAFGMDIVHHSRHSGIPLDDLLAVSDVVTLHTPLTEQTRGLIGREQLRRMKPSTILVNTARGAVVDQVALAEALGDGTIAGAGIDVMVAEPIPTDDPLLALPNCLVTPHIGSATLRTRTEMADLAVQGAIDVLTGVRPAHIVNPAVLG